MATSAYFSLSRKMAVPVRPYGCQRG